MFILLMIGDDIVDVLADVFLYLLVFGVADEAGNIGDQAEAVLFGTGVILPDKVVRSGINGIPLVALVG